MAEKKTSELNLATKKSFIDRELKELTINRQCDLLELSRPTLYYQPCQDNLRNIALMRAIDEIYTKNPVYGKRRIQFVLRRLGYDLGRALIATLMKKMSIEAIYAKPNLSKANPGHKVYPYLLNIELTRANEPKDYFAPAIAEWWQPTLRRKYPKSNPEKSNGLLIL